MTRRELKWLAGWALLLLAALALLSGCNALVRTGIKIKVDIFGAKVAVSIPVESIPVVLFLDGGYSDAAPE